MSQSRAKGRVVVSGILFWYPLAGVTFQFLHYLLGLRRLGYDVYYIEDSGRYVYDPGLNDLTPEADGNVARVAPILEANGFAGKWAFRGAYPGGRCFGLSELEIHRLYRDCDAFLNVTGAQELRQEHLRCKRRLYIESDPFAAQVKAAQGNQQAIEALAGHDMHFTFGENIGSPGCDVPTAGFTWLPTRQPVALELWQHRWAPGERYTTITTWKNKGKDVTHQGETYYWTKDREFERVLDLPLLAKVPFELAVSASEEVREKLARHDWHQRESLPLSSDLDSYRTYIQRSRGEFTVARDQYVRPNTGWFSDRTACYLAAGRPVITQDTGFGQHLPTGRGLFSFRTTDDVLAAIEAIESDYRGHARDAAELATEYFAAEKVIGNMMARAGL